MVEITGGEQACPHCDSSKVCKTYNHHLGGNSTYTIQQTYDMGGCPSFRMDGKKIQDALRR